MGRHVELANLPIAGGYLNHMLFRVIGIKILSHADAQLYG